MATKKKATPPHKPLIDHKGVTDVPPLKEPPTVHWVEDRLTADLVPDRWWKHNASAPLDISRPIVRVSAQVAQVLEAGINSAVTRLHDTEDMLRRTKERTYVVDEQLSWTRHFLENARERLNKATSATWVDDALAVVAGIETVLAEDQP